MRGIVLFGRDAIEGRVVGYRIGFGLVDETVFVIGRCVERVELHYQSWRGIDNVVSRSFRNDNDRVILDGVFNAVENRFPFSLFNPDELVKLVHFFPDILIRLQAHDYQLQVFVGVQHLAEIIIGDGTLFNVGYVSFHALEYTIQLILGPVVPTSFTARRAVPD